MGVRLVLCPLRACPGFGLRKRREGIMNTGIAFGKMWCDDNGTQCRHAGTQCRTMSPSIHWFLGLISRALKDDHGREELRNNHSAPSAQLAGPRRTHLR